MRGRPREFDKNKAIQAALEVFWKHGYEGTSCEELLNAMGINSGSMYSAFGDKKALYDKAFDLYCQNMVGKGIQILDGPEPPLENVRNMIRCWAGIMSHPDCKGCFIDSTLIEFGNDKSGVAEMARRVINRLQKTIEEKLIAAQQDGSLAQSTNPAELALFIVNVKQGLSVMSRAGAGEQAIQSVINTTLSILK